MVNDIKLTVRRTIRLFQKGSSISIRVTCMSTRCGFFKMLVFLLSVISIPLFSSLSWSGNDAPVHEGLVLAYDFHEANPTKVKDLSGNGLNGQLWGSPRFAESPTGKALVFDGKGAPTVIFTPMDPLLELGGKLTLDVWLWLGEPSDQHRLVLTTPGTTFRIQVAPENRAYFGMKNANSRADLAGGNLRVEGWNRITGVFNRPEMTLYVNGEQVASRNWDNEPDEGGAVAIGGFWGRPDRNEFLGRIDQVRIYKVARPPGEGDETPLRAR